jgi:hypothetical protein
MKSPKKPPLIPYRFRSFPRLEICHVKCHDDERTVALESMHLQKGVKELRGWEVGEALRKQSKE